MVPSGKRSWVLLHAFNTSHYSLSRGPNQTPESHVRMIVYSLGDAMNHSPIQPLSIHRFLERKISEKILDTIIEPGLYFSHDLDYFSETSLF
jgi:hypothetical protein